MVSKRILPAFFIGSMLLLSALSTVPANGGESEDRFLAAPTLSALINASEVTLAIEAQGLPGQTGLFRLGVAFSDPGVPGFTFVLPMIFDANGEWSLPAIQLDGLAAVFGDFDLIMDVVTVAGDTVQESEPWGLRLREYPVGSPNVPAAGTGGVMYYPYPGTQAPEFPYSWASISVGSEIAVFHCAPTGIEGVIPVN